MNIKDETTEESPEMSATLLEILQSFFRLGLTYFLRMTLMMLCRSPSLREMKPVSARFHDEAICLLGGLLP